MNNNLKMKILLLLPPSEGKNSENKYKKEELSFSFEKPLEIATNVTEKDLKCTWDRFKEWLKLNKKMSSLHTPGHSLLDKSNSPCPSPEGEGVFIEAINRYTWVMFNAIDYSGMNDGWKKFFEENFLIFSGMYWIVKPLDKIANYKLPVETKWLYQFWWDKIPEKIVELKPDYIVNLLPISYAKLIWLLTPCNRHKKKLNPIIENWTKLININFLKPDGKKISHWVKKIKGEWIKKVCEENLTDYKQFWWQIVENWNVIDINIVKS